MSDLQSSDDSYMAMLNNPTINPGPAAPSLPKETSENSRLKSSSLQCVQEAKDKLVKASKDVYLASESDEKFEWVNTTTKSNKLPSTIKELVQLGFIEEEDENQELKITTIDDILNDEEYQDIVKAFGEISGKSDDSKVYLIGELEITVLILCIVQDSQSKEAAIVGLKSKLVQT